MIRRGLLVLSIVLMTSGAGSARAEDESSGFDFWTPHYVVDYGLGAGGLLLELFYRGSPREQALIGPSFDANDPGAILSPEYSDVIGRPFMHEDDWTIPNHWLEIAAYGQLLLVPGHELLAAWSTGRPVSAHRIHHSLVSVFQATAVNAGLSRVVKSQVGRLRPDFQDRVRHVYCSLPDSEGIDCEGVDPDLLFDDPDQALKDLREGRYSFWSGHAANGMLVATNLALQTGGLWVWGEDATPASRGIGIGAMVVFGAMGAWSGISRTGLVDGVHHDTDVLVGSIAGVAIGNLFYWLHFDTRGRPRPQHWLNRRASVGRDDLSLSDIRLTFMGTAVSLSAAW